MKKILWKIHRFLNPYQKTVYYDPKTNQFFQEKFAQDNGVLCSGQCNYYEDAMTNTGRDIISYDYIWNCERVGAIDKFPQATFNSAVNAWRVK